METPAEDPRLDLLKLGSRRPELSVKGPCNLSCFFCNCRSDAPAIEAGPHFEQVREQIERLAAAGVKSASWGVFSYEPTTFPRLPELLAHAFARGIERHQLITNGIRTADRGYLQELHDHGVRELSMSIFEWDEVSADTLTDGRGVLAAKLATADHCRSLGIELLTPVILMRVNYLRVREVLSLYRGLSSSFSLRPIYPGIGERVSFFLPPVTGVAEALATRCADLDLGGATAVLGGIPACVRERWADALSGFGIAGDEAKEGARCCTDCADHPACAGLSPEYLELYGDAELREEAVVHRPIELSELVDWAEEYIGRTGGQLNAGTAAGLHRLLEALLPSLPLPCDGYLLEALEEAHHDRVSLRLHSPSETFHLIVALRSQVAQGLETVGPLTLMLPREEGPLDAPRQGALRALVARLEGALAKQGALADSGAQKQT